VLPDAALPPFERLDDPVPHARFLSNGSYTAVVTSAGTGFSTLEGVALTTFEGDRTSDRDGLFVYVRDLDSDTVVSIGHQPLRRRADVYEAAFFPGRLRIARTEGDLETSVEICVPPGRNLELRHIVLRNRSSWPRRLEVTTYAEVALAPLAAHAAHPAFSKLFVQTALVARRRVLLATRRPRSREEPRLWLAHALVGGGALEHETDRARFLGRGRAAENPRGLRSPLGATVGSVLDPVLVLRRRLVVPPRRSRVLLALLAAADDHDAAVSLVSGWSAGKAVVEAFAAAAQRESELRRRLGLDDRTAEALQELAGQILYRAPALRAQPEFRSLDGAAIAREELRELAPQPGLWRVAIEVRSAPSRRLLQGLAYWAALGFRPDVVLVSAEPAATEAVLREARRELDLPQSLRVLSEAELSPDRRWAIRNSADLFAREDLPRPPAGDRRLPLGPPISLAVGAPESEEKNPPEESREAEPLLWFNGWGGFAPGAREYVIRLDPGRERPPMPWSNVVANEEFGFLVSESGAGFTWSRNSRQNRLTPWSNDPVSDPHGEALYLRDEETGRKWSPLPGPCPSEAPVEVRHGFGESRWHSTAFGIEQDVCTWVPRRDSVRVIEVRLGNRDGRPRVLSLFFYARLVLGVSPAETAPLVTTEYDRETGAILARRLLPDEFATGTAFAAAIAEGRPKHFTADRTTFLGRMGSERSPAALEPGAELDGRVGPGLDPCAAFSVEIRLAPGETVECAFLLGEGENRAAALELVGRYRDEGTRRAARDEVRRFWNETLSAVEVETPAPAIDVLLNGWLLYQCLSCRLWGRSAFYQSGGAFGFRDQLQDAAGLVYSRPDLVRRQLLLHAAHQFVEGDVLHWWHPPADLGTRTRFSDDLLWLPYVTTFYVETTGDRSVLDESVPFIAARPLAPGEDEAYVRPEPSGERGSLYEHCCRAIDRSLRTGPHGLPLMGTGDWNDGMNRVGREGRGESVWLAFFLFELLGRFADLAESRGDRDRAQRYREHRERLQEAIEREAWDGEWYCRAWYDDGTPLGSSKSDECRIDALAQAWAVLSKAAAPERAVRALEAVERWLVSEEDRVIRLLAPPFDRTPHDPGYIKGYVPGIRENGGQYTHAALWVVRAAAELGWRDRAARWLEMLSPLAHAASPARVAVYRVEPYAVAADVYAEHPHVGRGGWTWYTGSAAWMYRVALESILGFSLEAGRWIRIAPRIPDGWPGYRLRYRHGDGTEYEISVENPNGQAEAVASAELDHSPLPVDRDAARIALRGDGMPHRVRVVLGPASAPR
jgi:cyclic beta-1,2-glucan synthetase